LIRCRANAEDLSTCLEKCRRSPDRFYAWLRILEGRHEDMVEVALRTEDYFDLPPTAMAWWENVLQNHPFAVFLAKERYAALLKKREKTRCD